MQGNRTAQKEKSSADVDWLSLTMKGNFHSLKVYELDKYLSYYGLMKKRKKEDKVKTVMHHELRNKDPVKIMYQSIPSLTIPPPGRPPEIRTF